jgi:hypothetical protein
MTALQQVFSDLEELHPNLFNVYTTEGKEFINHFHKYLELEKQQIIEAHGNKKKTKSNPDSIVTYGYTFTGEEYYNKTYKNTKQ